MKKYNQGFLNVFLFLIAAVAIAGGIYYYSSAHSSVYNDPNFGIKFQIPSGWRKITFNSPAGDTPGVGETIGYTFNDTGNYNGKFQITKTAATNKPLGSSNIVYKNTIDDAKLGVVQGDGTFNGLPAYKIVTGGEFEGYSNGEPNGNNLPLKDEYWYVTDNGNTYEIYLESSVDYYNKNQDLINNLLDSVQFTK